MPQPRKASRHGGSAAHQKAILSNLATELVRHGRITTTHAKARSVQPLAEKMITFAKRGDIHARRQVLRVIRDKDVVHKLFADVGPAFAERDGGYTRILKLGPRKGDAAEMALIELVQGVEPGAAVGDLEEQPRRRWSLRRRRGTISQSARETAEERQAAIDRGEDVGGEYEDEMEMAEAVPAGGLSTAEDDAEVTPEQVEARLAAADEVTESDEVNADTEAEAEAEAEEPEAAADDEPDATDEDAPPSEESKPEA